MPGNKKTFNQLLEERLTQIVEGNIKRPYVLAVTDAVDRLRNILDRAVKKQAKKGTVREVDFQKLISQYEFLKIFIKCLNDGACLVLGNINQAAPEIIVKLKYFLANDQLNVPFEEKDLHRPAKGFKLVMTVAPDKYNEDNLNRGLLLLIPKVLVKTSEQVKFEKVEEVKKKLKKQDEERIKEIKTKLFNS